MNMAEHISQWSKDPSTKVGAVIVRPNLSIASVGYNGFPKGVNDFGSRYKDRDIKYRLTVHAETNALAFCQDARPLTGYTIFIYPFLPCTNCAGTLIQHGIAYVVAPPMPKEQATRWQSIMEETKMMFDEAKVTWEEFEKTK